MNDGPLAADLVGASDREPSRRWKRQRPGGRQLRVLGYAANGEGDNLALDMLMRLLGGLPIVFEQRGTRLLAADLIRLVGQQNYDVVCIADLPPSAPSKTRYLVRRLRAAFPELADRRWPMGAPGSGGRHDAAARGRRSDARRRDVAGYTASACRARESRHQARARSRERRLSLQTARLTSTDSLRLLQPGQAEQHGREAGVVVFAAAVRQQVP